MKLRLLLIALFCAWAVPAWGAPGITVSATGVSILGTNTPISISVTLIDPNSTGNLRIAGTGVIPIMQASTVTPGTTATVGPIYGNDVIVDGFGNANSTYYKVQVFTVTNGIIASTPSLQNFYAFTGTGTVDLSTATPVAPSFMTGANGSVVIPGNLTVNGGLTFLGGLVAGSLSSSSVNTALYVGGTLGSSWGSGDIGAQINAAYAALPANGGKIYILPQVSGACYAFSTPIALSTSGKYPILEGVSGANSSAAVDGNICLNFTPTTGTAITAAWAPTGGGGYVPGAGFRGFTLINNGCVTNGGCASSAFGVNTTGGGMHFGFVQNVKIVGFGTAWNWGDTGGVGWGAQFQQVSLVQNTLGMAWSNVGEEKFTWFGGSCATNATCMNNTASLSDTYLYGVSIDSNTVLGVSNAATFQCFGCHFENLGQTNAQYITQTGGSTHIIGGEVLNDSTSGTVAQLFSASAGFFQMEDTAVFSGGQTVTNILNNTSNGVGDISVSTFSPTPIASLCSVASNCTGSLRVGSQPSYQMPIAIFPEGTTVTGISGKTVCGDSNSTHSLQCSNNGDSPAVVARAIAASSMGLPSGGAIAPGSCATPATNPATGALTTDSVQWSLNASPIGVTGYGSGGSLIVYPWATAGNVNFTVCNPTAGSITPGAMGVNYKVLRP